MDLFGKTSHSNFLALRERKREEDKRHKILSSILKVPSVEIRRAKSESSST